MIDLGSNAVEIFTKLVDTFGGLSGILGLGLGGFLQFSGNGLFRKNGMGQWESNRWIKGAREKWNSSPA